MLADHTLQERARAEAKAPINTVFTSHEESCDRRMGMETGGRSRDSGRSSRSTGRGYTPQRQPRAYQVFGARTNGLCHSHEIPSRSSRRCTLYYLEIVSCMHTFISILYSVRHLYRHTTTKTSVQVGKQPWASTATYDSIYRVPSPPCGHHA